MDDLVDKVNEMVDIITEKTIHGHCVPNYLTVSIRTIYFWLWHSREPYKSLGPYYCYSLCATNFEAPPIG